VAAREPTLTLGLEEEYLLVEAESGAVASEPPEELFAVLESRTDGRAFPELLKAQIEVVTPVCRSVQQARSELAELREAVIEEAGRFGLAPVAASSHPFSLTAGQKRTERERYISLIEEMQGAARRMMICGLHVHVGIEDDDLRIDTMNQLSYFLPHLLAMSCSSPFWEAERTGLMSFRLGIFNGVPRTGLPEFFTSWAEYQRVTGALVDNRVIADRSRIWWDLRPSERFPTLETRVMDCCTTLEDAVRLAALNQCLIRMLYRLRRANQRWRTYSALLVGENRWRAMRYSTDSGLLDLGRRQIVDFPALLEELIELVREDAEALGCVEEIDGLREILDRGTSAHRQLRTYEQAISDGCSEGEALRAVVKWLVEETAAIAQGRPGGAAI
jgi:carboxylate-amine ligase